MRVVLFFLKLSQFENETATHVEGYVMCKMKSHEREKERKKMETWKTLGLQREQKSAFFQFLSTHAIEKTSWGTFLTKSETLLKKICTSATCSSLISKYIASVYHYDNYVIKTERLKELTVYFCQTFIVQHLHQKWTNTSKKCICC